MNISPSPSAHVQPLRIEALRKWSFSRDGNPACVDTVELPHCPFEPDPHGREHWQGLCHYQRSLQVAEPFASEHITLYFHAAMHSVVVRLDELEIARHAGGYLPFEINVTKQLRDGRPHLLGVELDNRDNPEVPPGKPRSELDFCWYGGLYRPVELRRYPAVHISDAATAGEVAGGGLFVRTLRATETEAELFVRVHLRNTANSPQRITLAGRILQNDAVVASLEARELIIPPNHDQHEAFQFNVRNPALWSPASPALHLLEVDLTSSDGKLVDRRRERFGIRHLEVSRSGGIRLNGQRVRPRGTNRHMDHPWVGYAIPAAADRRDARRIKEAGFDYVRLSHYPQSPDFLDACDELGILVTNCISGWQFMGNEHFREACFDQARRLIRRDRNHPCVLFWELSLNETPMDPAFMDQLHAIGHEELPGDQTCTAGWQDHYDVFMHARQHGLIHDWCNGDKALVVSEYGDWEFYASNEGFDQKSGQGLLPAHENSRAFPGDGEAKLLQQAINHATALNDTLASPAVCDGQWSIFDYPRGYDPIRAACGVMDFFRRPKFSFHFYRSQRDSDENSVAWSGGPMVFIASHWNAGSSPEVWVFSNTGEVELRLNDRTVARQTPSRRDPFRHLPHPPFIFDLGRFQPGSLEATAFLDGHPVASHRVTTAGEPHALELRFDESTSPITEEEDLLFLRARIVDAHGNLCVHAEPPVTIQARAPLSIKGPSTLTAEAGIASFLIHKPAGSSSIHLSASAPSLKPGRFDGPPPR